MHTADLDVVKDIPGYKVILKAVLRSQIQQLVEQLATHTDEESVILSANVTDGTLCHLGSESGKCFLEDHDAVKSQFLGFCLKRYHTKKSEANKEATQNVLASLSRSSSQQSYGAVSSQSFSPKVPNSRSRGPHPVSLSKAPVGLRHDPYARNRPARKQFDKGPQASRSAAEQTASNEVIKIEPTSDSRDSDSGAQAFDTSKTSQGSSPAPAPAHTPNLDTKSDVSDEDNSDMPFASDDIGDTSYDNQSDVPGSMPAGQDSVNVPGTSGDLDASNSAEYDANLSVKSESMMESEYDLEASGMEPGGAGAQDAGWGPEGLGFDPTGATGNPSDMPGDQSYRMGMPTGSVAVGEKDGFENPLYICGICDYQTQDRSDYNQHIEKHNETIDDLITDIIQQESTEPKQEECTASMEASMENATKSPKKKSTVTRTNICSKCGNVYTTKYSLTKHEKEVHDNIFSFKCGICGKGYNLQSRYKIHMASHDSTLRLRCHICDKAFNFPKSLDEHLIAQHTSRTFECQEPGCTAVFKRKNSLLEHISGMHNQRKVVCQLCGENFKWRSSLKNHMRTKHKM